MDVVVTSGDKQNVHHTAKENMQRFSPSQNSPSNFPNPVAYAFQSRSQLTDPSILR
jgi:hypothetical protein